MRYAPIPGYSQRHGRAGVRWLWYLVAVVAGAAVALLGSALEAEASEVVRSCSAASCARNVVFTGDAGEANDVDTAIVSTQQRPREFWIADLNNVMRLGATTDAFTDNGCRRPDPGEYRQAGPQDLPRNHVAACRWGDDGRYNLRLGDGNDRAWGAGSGEIHGGTGRDVLRGAGLLEGGDGDDRLTGDDGRDDLRGGDGEDLLIGYWGPDDLRGGSGFDTITYDVYLQRASTVHVTIADGNTNDGGRCDLNRPSSIGCTGEPWGRGDQVFGDVEKVVGGTANDVLIGDASDETLIGLAGNDRLRGNEGDDTLWGGGRIAVSDGTLVFGGTNDLGGGEGNDTLYGGIDADLLAGGAGNDDLIGDQDSALEGSDSLAGGPGNDTLDGGKRGFRSNGSPDSDYLVGGDGVDTVDYSQRTAALDITLNNAEDDGQANKDGGEQDNVASDVENIRSGSGDDFLSGNQRDNRFEAGGGDDTMVGRLGADIFKGGLGTDTVTYSERTAGVTATIDNVFNDGVTYDVEGVPTSEGDNVAPDVEGIIGGAGDDDLAGGKAAGVWLRGGPGDDILRGSSLADHLSGNDGDDTIYSAFDNVTDIVEGAKGADTAQVDEIDDVSGIESFIPT